MNIVKRTVAALVSLLGISTSSIAQDTKMVDPKTLLYSLATIENALPALSNGTQLGNSPLELSEDDWRQFEFVSANYSSEIQTELKSIDDIFAQQSIKLSNGWLAFKKLHVRERIPVPLAGNLSWKEFTKTLGPDAVSLSSVTFRGAPTAIGDGFAIKLGAAIFYGLRNGDRISVLCIESGSAKPALLEGQAKSLTAFLHRNGLLLVHWTSRTTIEGEARLIECFSQK